MKAIQACRGTIISSVIVPAVAVLLVLNVPAAPSPSPKEDKSAQQQIAELQAKVKQLEAAVQSHTQPPLAASPATSAMTGMGPSSRDGMSIENMNMGAMSSPGASPGSAGMSGMENMMGTMGQMMGMKMMGMNAMPSGSAGMSSVPRSVLPGFPGVSHLYHIGSTGFFLDHADHISLSPDQQAALKNARDQALNVKTTLDRQIERAENELATLTSADQPDSGKIDAKVREIEKLRADQRLAFIRAVGEAAKLLTDDQRKILVGAMQPNSAMPSPSPSMSPMEHM